MSSTVREVSIGTASNTDDTDMHICHNGGSAATGVCLKKLGWSECPEVEQVLQCH